MEVTLDGVWKDWDRRALVQLFGVSACAGKDNLKAVKGVLRKIEGEWAAPGFVPSDLLLRSVMPKHELLIRVMDIYLDHSSDQGEYYKFEGVTLRPAPTGAGEPEAAGFDIVMYGAFRYQTIK